MSLVWFFSVIELALVTMLLRMTIYKEFSPDSLVSFQILDTLRVYSLHSMNKVTKGRSMGIQLWFHWSMIFSVLAAQANPCAHSFRPSKIFCQVKENAEIEILELYLLRSVLAHMELGLVRSLHERLATMERFLSITFERPSPLLCLSIPTKIV